MNKNLIQFGNQKYLSLETFRKNGQSMKTPVWFVQEGEELYIWTESSSGKVKRIRNSARVKVTSSQGDGTPIGEWLDATACVDDSEMALKHVRKLMGQKYGFVFTLFEILGKLRKSHSTTLLVRFVG